MTVLALILLLVLSGCGISSRVDIGTQPDISYIIVEDPSSILPKVAYVGSFSYPRDRRYMIPLINQLFQDIGSVKYPKSIREEILKSLGGSLAISFKDDGSFVFTADGVSSGFETINDLLVSLVLEPDFDQETLEIKKGVVCEGLRRAAEKPFQLAFVTVREFLSPEIKPQLDCELLNSTSLESVKDFYRSIKLNKVRAISNLKSDAIEASLKKFSLNKEPVSVAGSVGGLWSGIKVVWVEAPFTNQTTVWAIRSENLASDRRFENRFIAQVVAEEFDSPVFKSIRSDQGLAYVADGGWSADFSRGYFYFAVQHQPEHLTKVLESLVKLSKSGAADEIDSGLVDRNKLREKRKVIFEQEALFQTSAQDQLRLIFGVPLGDDRRYIEYLEKLTFDEFKTSAQKLLSKFVTSTSLLIIIGNQDPSDQVQSILKNVIGHSQPIHIVRAKFDNNFKLLY